MQLDLTTFLLEVINFLILVWLLKRFLYRPVLNVVAQRRRKIEAELAAADEGQREAAELKRQYEERLADWEREKRVTLNELEQKVEQERSRRLQQLEQELEQQRLKNQARGEQQQAQLRRQAEMEALQLGAAFAARLLKTLSGPELDSRLQQLFIDQLAALPETSMRELREAWRDGNTKVEVVGATALDANRQQAIRQALEQKLGHSEGQWMFSQDEKLIAGLRVSVGGWVLEANVKDELRFFSAATVGHGE